MNSYDGFERIERDDYILSSHPENPSGCRWFTIGHGETDVTMKDFDIIRDYFLSLSPAGAMALEKGEKGHAHVHVACIIENLNYNWSRDLYNRLKWDGKKQSKWLQNHNKKWSANYTWQKLVGGYVYKDHGRKVSWGINPQYLLQGKVAYTAHIDERDDKKELTPFNIIKVLCHVGRKKNCKTADDALKACIKEKYSTWKLIGKLKWEGVRIDYKLKVHSEEPKTDDLIRSFERFDRC